ncbi:M24 family metallopeptidase [Sphingomonas hengshuiensis]|uniref:(Fe-S)-binding protein n=1 Tax=Sphingomonas hengshuiensis TaxID=1609977 RepID=A0A7U4LEH1_9SPHN|nr:M24 family metallopeptidase [Sphingomonas hengshuiensis]AJP71203.1 (Fe-S)-binding protein [Sphingomonas hengshuiensis]
MSVANDRRQVEERNGAHFDPAMMVEAAKHTRAAIHAIAAAIHPGMVEEDAVAMARRMLKAREMLRGWHGIHVRFGPNTMKNFGERSDPGVLLREDDIFFIDIGPVWRGYEGDGGDTFVVGNDPDMARAARDVRAVFDATSAAWREEGLTGAALYRRAALEAEARGWQLNLDMSGHRLSDFPHAVKFDGPLRDIDYTPSSGLWVLEIQIRHPERRFSAFYESLLV